MLELRHLRYFIAVAENLNFRRASERVHIDPSPQAVESQEVVHGRDAAHGRLVVESGVWPAPVVAVNEGLQGSLELC